MPGKIPRAVFHQAGSAAMLVRAKRLAARPELRKLLWAATKKVATERVLEKPDHYSGPMEEAQVKFHELVRQEAEKILLRYANTGDLPPKVREKIYSMKKAAREKVRLKVLRKMIPKEGRKKPSS